MDFLKIAEKRQSCRKYDSQREVEAEKLERILKAAQLSPSACNGQPYHITICKGETAKKVAKATQGMGINAFAPEAPILMVISEEPYVKTAALGAKLKGIDYRSIDMGILAAYITAQAESEGLATCILGWLDSDKIQEICSLPAPAKLVITLGYAAEGDKFREKKRKALNELVSYK